MKLFLPLLSTLSVAMVFALPAHHHSSGGEGSSANNTGHSDNYVDSSNSVPAIGFNPPSNVPGFGIGKQSRQQQQGQQFSLFTQGQGGFPNIGNDQPVFDYNQQGPYVPSAVPKYGVGQENIGPPFYFGARGDTGLPHIGYIDLGSYPIVL
ncbi:AGAP006505-PA [Anopheles gambiae str. PEST]|uniref:AGAP006505-PA n=1 Tax=Anopheles gambiae TaxID=7165 RepID=A7UUB9_ANOGA|nr:AGAP006505-PA [Anopheles gambiae str. PEST]